MWAVRTVEKIITNTSNLIAARFPEPRFLTFNIAITPSSITVIRIRYRTIGNELVEFKPSSNIVERQLYSIWIINVIQVAKCGEIHEI